MIYHKSSYMDHVAIRVKDIRWHIGFFREALGMSIVSVDGPLDNPKQVWLQGGLQLVADSDFDGDEGRMAHLGIVTEDLKLALRFISAWGVAQLPKGENWLELPDGVCIELIQAKGNSGV